MIGSSPMRKPPIGIDRSISQAMVSIIDRSLRRCIDSADAA